MKYRELFIGKCSIKNNAVNITITALSGCGINYVPINLKQIKQHDSSVFIIIKIV